VRTRFRIFLSIHFCLLVIFSSFSSIQAVFRPFCQSHYRHLLVLSFSHYHWSYQSQWWRTRRHTQSPQIPCFCPRPPIPFPVPGIPVGFWEPARLVDVTRVPFCMVSMGGLKMGNSFVNYGVHGANGEQRTQNSFYQVHWYVILSFIGLS
jgi:hypothetical protein